MIVRFHLRSNDAYLSLCHQKRGTPKVPRYFMTNVSLPVVRAIYHFINGLMARRSIGISVENLILTWIDVYLIVQDVN